MNNAIDNSAMRVKLSLPSYIALTDFLRGLPESTREQSTFDQLATAACEKLPVVVTRSHVRSALEAAGLHCASNGKTASRAFSNTGNAKDISTVARSLVGLMSRLGVDVSDELYELARRGTDGQA